jgi:hypothetical protein
VKESVYKVIEIVGSSPKSWEKAAEAAVKTASRSLRDLRVAEVGELDMHIVDGKIVAYRAKLKVSFKYGTDGPREESDDAGEAGSPERAYRNDKPGRGKKRVRGR